MANTRVKVEMEEGGSFIIELMPEYAPKTAENFEKLVEEGFYDGLTFHRVIDGFMAQGGDPMGTRYGREPGNHTGRVLRQRLSGQHPVSPAGRNLHGTLIGSKFRQQPVLYLL